MDDRTGARVRFALYFTLVCATSTMLGLSLTETPLSEDPKLYYERVSDVIVSGQVPYLESNLEHLPLSFAAMVAAWYLGGSGGVPAYTIVFALLMSFALYVTARLIASIGSELDVEGAHWTFLFVAGPLFPLVIFRNDPISTALAAAAFLALLRGKQSEAIWTSAAVAAKGWPVVLVLAAWWKGRRRVALIVTAWTVMLVGLLLAAPGFRSGRSFDGIHMETTFGSAVGLGRAIVGDSLGLFEAAGAVYVDVASEVVLIQFAVGFVAAIWFARHVMNDPYSGGSAARLLAGISLIVLLTSPLLSAQFLLWPITFLSLIPERSMRWGSALLSVLTVAYVALWPGLFYWTVGWLGIIVARNLLMLVLIGGLARRRPTRLKSQLAAE
jgi:hypothetical protein